MLNRVGQNFQDGAYIISLFLLSFFLPGLANVHPITCGPCGSPTGDCLGGSKPQPRY
jgi:tetrahydromethanopterin S-methyltransferase subunit E